MTVERLALARISTSIRPGRRPRDIVEAVRLDFIGFRPGSAIIELRRPPQTELINDLLDDSLQMLEEGVQQIRKDHLLPPHFTAPVINGLRQLAGGIGPGGVSRIEFRRPGGGFVIDPVFREARHGTPVRPMQNDVVVVGRLHMGDFSPAILRCRIGTYAGSIPADFDGDLRDTVLDAMDQLVMARGRAELQPDGVTVRVMHLKTLNRLANASVSTLDTLARQQGVSPFPASMSCAGLR